MNTVCVCFQISVECGLFDLASQGQSINWSPRTYVGPSLPPNSERQAIVFSPDEAIGGVKGRGGRVRCTGGHSPA